MNEPTTTSHDAQSNLIADLESARQALTEQVEVQEYQKDSLREDIASLRAALTEKDAEIERLEADKAVTFGMLQESRNEVVRRGVRINTLTGEAR